MRKWLEKTLDSMRCALTDMSTESIEKRVGDMAVRWGTEKLRLENRNTKVGLKLKQDLDNQNTATGPQTDAQSTSAPYPGPTGCAENPAYLELSLNAQSSTYAPAAQIKMTAFEQDTAPRWTHSGVQCQGRWSTALHGEKWKGWSFIYHRRFGRYTSEGLEYSCGWYRT